MVPIAENAVPITPKMVSMMDWKTAKIELMTAMMAPKMEETRFPRESIKEGMFVDFLIDLFAFGLFWLLLFLIWLLCCVRVAPNLYAR